MRVPGLLLFSVLTACSAQQLATQPPAAAAMLDGDTVTVRLSSFAFDPDTIRLTAGKPVRLRLVNDSNGGHNFSAPAFFAASNFPTGTSAPARGEIGVGSHQTVEVLLVPRQPATYALECTHPLHSLFGMTGKIEVTP